MNIKLLLPISIIFDTASFLCYQIQHFEESFRYYSSTFGRKYEKLKKKNFSKNSRRIHNRKTNLGLLHVKEDQMMRYFYFGS